MAHKLFVGNLPSDVTQEDLKTVFNTYGTTTDVHIMSGKSSSGQICAFVVYETFEAGEVAIASLDSKYCIREDSTSPIQVKWAKPPGAAPAPQQTYPPVGGYQPLQTAPLQYSAFAPPVTANYGIPDYGIPAVGGYGAFGGAMMAATAAPTGLIGTSPALGGGTSKLFVGNLPTDIQQDAIKMVFGTYGTVTNVHIMAGKAKSGQSCAFVEYSSPIEAETAILTLHEKYEIRPGAGNLIVKYSNNSARPRPY
jgi:RNA recognition motif-containing protein